MNRKISLLLTLLIAVGLLTAVFNIVLAAPSLTNNGLTVDEGSTGNIISTAELLTIDNAAPGATYTYTVSSVPTNGILRNNGAELFNGNTFNQVDINNNLLTYAHDGSESLSDNFIFSVEDLTGTIAAAQSFVITVNPINDPPTANPDTIYLLEGGSVSITGAGNISLLDNDTDPDNNQAALTANTSPVSGPTHATVAITTTGIFTYTHNGSENFNDTFDYRVCDLQPLCDDGTVTVVITPVVDIAPTVADQTLNVNENSGIGLNFGPISATDTEVNNGYDTLTYSIIDGNQGNAFNINSGNGRLIVANPVQLNHEVTASITLTVQVADLALLSDTAVITVNITDINEPPIIDAHSFTKPENSPNGTVIGDMSAFASDPDDGDSITYSITIDTLSAFAIDPNSGVITVTDSSKLDFESGSFPHNITVQVEDSGGLTDAANVTINLDDINEAPTINNDTFNIDENSPNGANVGLIPSNTDPDGDSVTFSIMAGDPAGVFTIGLNNGQITVNNSSLLDHEDTPQFSLTVEIEDTGNLTDTATITIDVNDINEAPVVAPSQTFSIPENSINGYVVGTVNANDEDDGDSFTFATTDSTFAIDSNSGEITVMDTGQLDFETAAPFVFMIMAFDGALTGTENITVTLTNVNEAPTVPSGQNFTIEGFSDNGTAVGQVNATDPDAGDDLTFTIVGSGNPNNAFVIDGNSGQITVGNRDQLDFDITPQFNLTVRATDILGKTDDETVVVNLTKPPVFALYLPLILNNYRADEPNNKCSESYAISTNTTLSFLPEDQEDWYSFTINNPTNVVVTLSNYVPVGQILAYSGNCSALNLLQNNGNGSPTKVLNLGNLAAGTYFVRVFTDAPFNSTQSYNLHISAP